MSIEYRVYKHYLKNKLLDQVGSKLLLHYSKMPHTYGFPKVHETNVPRRAIVISRFVPVYKLCNCLLLS